MIKTKKLLIILSFVISLFQISPNPIFAKNNSPKVTAKGAILIDFETGRVIWEKNALSPLPMASTTKIMTAITAIENGNLSDIVTVSKKASLAPPVKMKLVKNEKITLKNLLYSLMLQSSNDAAIAIAEHIGTSVENFCKIMTEKAKTLGAKDTLFVTPNGLDSGNHHSTPYDMALITRYALKNETFREIITTKNVSFKSNKQSYNITNKNRLLSEFAGANGVKTGFTGKAGHCFVGSAKQNNLWLISVVLASGWGNKGKEQKWIDTKEILNYGFANYEYQTPILQGTALSVAKVQKGVEKSVTLTAKNNFKVCIKKDGSEKIKIIKKIKNKPVAPIKENEPLGTAEIYINDKLQGTVTLTAKKSVERKNFFEYFKQIIKFWSTKNIFQQENINL